MANWGTVFAKLKNQWNNLRQSMQPYLNCDNERCLDLIIIGAGIRPLAGPEPWKRKCLILYRLLGFYHFMMAVAKIGFSIRDGNDTLGLCSSIAVLGGHVSIIAKVYILGFYDEAVRRSKTFVNSNSSFSGDPNYDATVRRCYASVPGKLTVIFIVIFCCDQVVVLIPTSARDIIYGIPEQFQELGTFTARLLQEMYHALFFILWGCGYFISSLTIIPLLNGLKNELMIINRGYELITERRQCQAMDDQLNLKQLKQMLRITVEQHVEVLRIVHLVQPVISYTYAIIYYCVIFNVAMIAFIVIRSEITLVMLINVGVSGMLAVVECYLWCRMIDSVQEDIEIIADGVAPMGFGLLHSVDNHSEYIEMRTSIMIVQLYASQCNWFSCGGIFPISVESFGDLCMILYKFVMFLLDID